MLVAQVMLQPVGVAGQQQQAVAEEEEQEALLEQPMLRLSRMYT